jgi:hypothetical protein
MRQGIYCASFDAHKVNIVREKKFGPLYCEWLKTLWIPMKRSLDQKRDFCYFWYFWKVHCSKRFSCRRSFPFLRVTLPV